MKIIKKLDIFILKAFLQLFAGTFFICLFIFQMQFIWRYMDDLIGKGLAWDVLALFFWYSGLTLIPLALPLAVLLASLISFGNMGERFELLSMKAAGIPLVRILQPVVLLSLLICGGSFVFQNRVGPYAMRELSRLLWSMRQKSPELEIPEGIFYNEIPGYNLYVEHKDAETGMLYGVMIYSNTNGYEDAEIVLADSARLQSTEEKMHLKLTLWNGERFRNMDTQSGSMLKASVPYMRESFIQEVDLIPFDNNFNLMDADLFSGNAKAKNMAEIQHGLDSLRLVSDSTGHAIARSVMEVYLNHSLPYGLKDSLRIVREAQHQPMLDSLFAALNNDMQSAACRDAVRRAETMKTEYEFRALITGDINQDIRKHRMELHKKFTMSLACLLFFFVGAPLGAIIRKGGLGLPVVISVIIFILYYIVNMAGENNAKVGAWTVEAGIWLSSVVLLPTGMFLIYKANKDSVVFNIEGYRNFVYRLLGLRAKRKLNRKEVIIHPPHYQQLKDQLHQLSEACSSYNQTRRLHMMPNYLKLYFHYSPDHLVEQLSEQLEEAIIQLHNSKDNVIIALINEYPFLATKAHTRPFGNARLNMAAGIILPVGIFFYFRIWRYRLRLRNDMQTIQKINTQIIDRITKQGYE